MREPPVARKTREVRAFLDFMKPIPIQSGKSPARAKPPNGRAKTAREREGSRNSRNNIHTANPIFCYTSNHLPAERRLRLSEAAQAYIADRLPITFPPKGDCDPRALPRGAPRSSFQSPSRRKAIATRSNSPQDQSRIFQSPSRRKAIATRRPRASSCRRTSNHLPAERRLRPGGTATAAARDVFQSPSRRKAIATAVASHCLRACRLPITFPPKGDCDIMVHLSSSRLSLPITFPPKGDCDLGVLPGVVGQLASNHLPAERRLRRGGVEGHADFARFQSPSRRKAIATSKSPQSLLALSFQSPSRRKAIATIRCPLQRCCFGFQSPSRRKAIATAPCAGRRGGCNFQSPSRRKAIATCTSLRNSFLLKLPITFPPKGDCDDATRIRVALNAASNHLPAERRLRHRPPEPPVRAPCFQSPSRRKAIAT